MLDIASSLLALQTILQIKDRVNVFILQFSLFKRNPRQPLISVLFQELAVNHIEISGHIQLHKFLTDQLFLIICQITVTQSFHLINEIICNRIHSGKQRIILELKVKQLNNLRLCFHKSLIFHISEIHQTVFQLHNVAFHKIDKFHGLFFLCQRNLFRETDSALDLIIAVLTVRNRIPQLLIGKKIKAHFLNVLFSQLRQDMRNIIGKYPVR